VDTDLLPSYPGLGRHLQVPYFRRAPEVAWCGAGEASCCLVGEVDQLTWMHAVVGMLGAYGISRYSVVVPTLDKENLPQEQWAVDAAFVASIVPFDQMLMDHRKSPYRPTHCAAFGSHPATNVLLETIRRYGTRVVQFQGTLDEFLGALVGDGAPEEEHQSPAELVEFGNDSGYAHVWKRIKTAQMLRI